MNLLKLLRSSDPTPGPVACKVKALLEHAISSGATDLHIEPHEPTTGRVRLRIDGFFHAGEPLDQELLPRVVARLKVLGGLAVFRTGEPQEGRITLQYEDRSVDLRLSTIPVVGGEKAVIRIFDPALHTKSLDALGFGSETLQQMREIPKLQDGVVFVVGPSSAGKTTTLYALAQEILRLRGEWTSVVSVEDPIEQRIPGISQTEIAPVRGFGFPESLAALLRQDPEVILVGETRDPTTARIAVEAGFTGHLVLSTFHVGKGSQVKHRLEMLDVPSYLIQESLRCVLNQRLVRGVCDECAGARCSHCRESGYRGRFAIGELHSMEQGQLVQKTSSLAEQAEQLCHQKQTTQRETRRVLGAC